MTVDAVTQPQVEEVDPTTDDRWEQLARGEDGTLFTSPPWLRALCAPYGFVPRARVGVDATGRPAGFAWVVVDDLRGRRVLSLPFSDRSDPVAGDPALWRRLSDGVVGPDVPVSIRALLPSPLVDDPRLERVGEAAWHGTPISGSAQDVFARLGRHARRNVGVARRQGVEVVADTGVDGVRAFHGLHVGLRRRKYRLLAQPLAFFESVWAEFAAEDAVTTLLAHHRGRLVAGALLLRWNDVLYYKFGASDPEHLSARPNDAVFWAVIELAISQGLRLVDWGLSDLDQPGLVAYKDKWATTQRRIATFRRAGLPPRPPAEVDHLLRGLTELLTGDDVPPDVSARGGALLYRYFC